MSILDTVVADPQTRTALLAVVRNLMEQVEKHVDALNLCHTTLNQAAVAITQKVTDDTPQDVLEVLQSAVDATRAAGEVMGAQAGELDLFWDQLAGRVAAIEASA